MVVLGPLLAQVATLSVADRTEARYIGSDDSHGEASTRPLAGLAVGWRHFLLGLGYSPSLTVLPLEHKPRDYLIFHSAYVSGSYVWEHSVFTLTEAAGYGSQNFQTLALADPRTVAPTPAVTGSPTATPTPGSGVTPTAGSQVRASNRSILFATSTTTASLEQRTSSAVTVRTEVAYLVAGALRTEDQRDYPIVSGPRGLVSAKYHLSRSNDFTAALTGQYASSSLGNSVWISTVTGTWAHKLDPNTATLLGVGVSGTRTPLTLGFVAYSIYPVATASISNLSKLARGTLGLSFGASTSPVVDLVTAVADPRVGLNAVASWQRDRFSANLTANSALSTASSGTQGALTAAGAAAGLGYRLGAAVSTDGGVRVAYQAFQGQTVIPLSYAVFVGVTFGLQHAL